jgi:UDP-N-acetylmuramyl pentapeptide phosphotransferase/UDP-N-acetylglucosamine-1-phosphate transferase
LLLALALFFAASALTAVILSLLLTSGLAWRIAIDQPNERSLHSRATPRCGGWGIMVTLLAFLAAVMPQLWQLTLALAALAAVSFIDDRRGLPVALRLSVQAAAVVLVLWPSAAGLSWPTAVVVVLAWLWLTNLYNFMDGSDGLAGSMTVIGFLGYALALSVSSPALIVACLAASGAALGFLRFNLPPARLFLGDAGSIPLGFLAGAIGYLGWRQGSWPFWFPFLLFSPFICDASVTLAKRLVRRERVWQAHREHYYQRLIQSGYSHRKTCSLWAGAMVLAGVLAYLLRRETPVWVGGGWALWLAALAGIGVWIDRRARQPATVAP